MTVWNEVLYQNSAQERSLNQPRGLSEQKHLKFKTFIEDLTFPIGLRTFIECSYAIVTSELTLIGIGLKIGLLGSGALEKERDKQKI